MQTNSLAEASNFNEVIANMAMHLSNPFFAEPEELQALSVQFNIYINDLTFFLNQYHREINEVNQYLPDLESCDIQHLSTALRIWNRVIGGYKMTLRFDGLPFCQQTADNVAANASPTGTQPKHTSVTALR